jgi:hypothetical protein
MDDARALSPSILPRQASAGLGGFAALPGSVLVIGASNPCFGCQKLYHQPLVPFAQSGAFSTRNGVFMAD